jgi:hypothetical protein
VHRKIKTDVGPLSVALSTISELADAVADAFGGECSIDAEGV